MKIEEVKIPVPWGHIAAKTWGDQANEAIIVSHGFQDNAASFDRIIPLLPKDFYYICIDLPGHGLSSNFSESLPIYHLNYLLAYKLVADYYKRSKYILMGHSFGGVISILFAQLYPELVSKLVIIDVVYTIPVDPVTFVEMIKNTHEVYFKNLERKSKDRRAYDYEEIVNKIVESRYNGWLTYGAGDILAKRMVKPVDNGKYVITLDPNLKGTTFPNATVDYYIELFTIRPVRCPVLMLLTPNNDYNDRSSRLLERFKEAGFCVKMINDHHHVHLTNPEVLVEDISSFLITDRTKLWGGRNNEAVLVIHGVLDNAGAFDNLIPHLPQHFYYICVDLPSHGKSTNMPSTLPIHVTDFILPIRIIVDYFNREKYICIGHSMGGQLLMLFSQLYPEKVSKLVLLDAIYVIPFHENLFLEVTKYGIERLLKMLKETQVRKSTFTYEEAIQKLVDGRDHGRMTKEAAGPLVRRMFEKIGDDKYVMNIDSRLKDRLYPSGTLEFMRELHRRHPVDCPVLILLSTGRGLVDIFGVLYEHYVEKGYEIHKYEGHHDMHNTNPEIIAPFVVRFLLKGRNKL